MKVWLLYIPIRPFLGVKIREIGVLWSLVGRKRLSRVKVAKEFIEVSLPSE